MEDGLFYLLVTTAVVAVTELMKRIRERDYTGVATILTAAVVGALAGVFGLQDLGVLEGIIAGLSAVGIHSVARQVG